MLIEFSDKGLYCRQGKFYIDPWKPVENAVITHAHSDHARPGHQNYLSHTLTLPLLKLRLGQNHYQSAGWNEPVVINGVKVSFHPSGHIIGAAQVRVEYRGEIWVVSGDYKTEDDGISGAFEPVRCHRFITESTFALPVYQWKPQQSVYEDMRQWITENRRSGKTSVFTAYSLGKSQRLVDAFRDMNCRVFVHPAIFKAQEVFAQLGFPFRNVEKLTPQTRREDIAGEVLITTGLGSDDELMKKITPFAVAACSGWMQVRGSARGRQQDKGFVLSDHADWNGLLRAVKATGAEMVYATHGFQSVFVQYLNEHGMAAAEVKTDYGELADEE